MMKRKKILTLDLLLHLYLSLFLFVFLKRGVWGEKQTRSGSFDDLYRRLMSSIQPTVAGRHLG